MRTLLFVTAALAIAAVSTPGQTAPVQKGKFVVSLGECVRLANARGWMRRGERGRYAFIMNCRRGKHV